MFAKRFILTFSLLTVLLLQVCTADESKVGNIDLKTYSGYSFKNVPQLLQNSNPALVDPLCLQTVLDHPAHKSYLAIGVPMNSVTAKREGNDLVVTFSYLNINSGYGHFGIDVRAKIKTDLNQPSVTYHIDGEPNSNCMIKAISVDPISGMGGPL